MGVDAIQGRHILRNASAYSSVELSACISGEVLVARREER